MQHDNPIRAAQELAERIKNPKAAEGLPGTIEDHADYVLQLIEQAPKPPTAEQEIAAMRLADLQRQRATIEIDAQINDEKPDAEKLERLNEMITRAEKLTAPSSS